jgi:flagellar assembly protein FliH
MFKVIRQPRIADPVILIGDTPPAYKATEEPSPTPPPEAPPSPQPEPPPDPEAVIAERIAVEVEKAYRRGVMEGREQAHREMEGEVRGVVERLTRLIDEITLERQNLFKTTQIFLVRLACAVAGRIINVSALTNSEAILDVISRSIAHLTEKTSLTIRVHPDDLEVVRQHRADWLSPESGVVQAVVEADPQVGRGGCLIDTDAGIVDGRIENQLRLLEDELVKKVAEEASA